jgi:hypothetical protein
MRPVSVVAANLQGEHPVLCMAGRSLIDEATAIMLAQLSTAHGLAGRVEAAEALSTTNVIPIQLRLC